MLILASINDLLQLGISSTGPIDVHASWVDVSNAGAITPGRLNQSLAVAGLANIVPSPPASTQRNVKTLHLRNKHASTPCIIIVVHYDGASSDQLFNTTLAGGRALQYTDQGGFRLL